jgi:hypothetical protein
MSDDDDEISSNQSGGGKGKANFFQYVFNFDDESKSDLSNISQYAVLSIIPIVMLNKLIQKYVPEADDSKGSIEILAEILIQLLSIFFGYFFINRIVQFVPTYSGKKYPEFQVIQNVIVTLLIILSLQTKIGEKVSIICDRVCDLWEGKTTEPFDNKKKKKSSSQPPNMSGVLGGGQNVGNFQQPQGMANMNQSSTPISALPDYNSGMNSNTSQAPEVFSNDIQGGVMAANEALGGGSFGSNF